MDHLKRAASIAAQETTATVGPRLNAAVERVQPAADKAKDVATQSWDSALAALTPLVAAAADNVRQAGRTGKKVSKRELKAQRKRADKLQRKADKALGREKSGRGSKLAGYALLGTAVGLGAAWYAKRRNQAQWEEYDAAPNPVTSTAAADDAAFEPLEPTVYTTSNGTAASVDKTGKTGPAK
ncbi:MULTISPECIES: hypothetical protein [unclassified Actinoplanes]|uniref:hypothetical protein n=1 Tax=unclassified Actinoplanes TaxID=2626549 RepID=UPI001E2D6E0C|nr:MULTISPECIES: hypothetical protein [unclassified Actinoplanes]